MYECFACAYVCVLCVCVFRSQQVQKKVLDSLDLELRKLVSCHIEVCGLLCWCQKPNLL